jgi:hypothetical protein
LSIALGLVPVAPQRNRLMWENPGFGFGALIGVIMLGVAIGWGIYRYNRRPRSNEPLTEAATKELYEHPDRYERETHDKLASKAK